MDLVSQELSHGMSDDALQRSSRTTVTPPIVLAVVRVQLASGRSGEGPSISVWPVDQPVRDRIAELQALEGVHRIAVLNSPNGLTLQQQLDGVGADLALVYSVRMHQVREDHFAPLSIVTLGASPTHTQTVEVLIDTALIDVRSGFQLGRSEVTGETWQLANTWTANEAGEQARERALKRAADAMLDEFLQSWPAMISRPAQERHVPIRLPGDPDQP